MRMISSFDPTAASSGTFDPQVVNPCGRILLFNESPVGLMLIFEDGSTAGLPPYYSRSYIIRKPGIVIWQQIYSLAIGGAPLSKVVGEAYESNEAKDLHWGEGPLNRQTNIGNSVPVSTSANTLTNDGGSANLSIIEATQSGAIGSNVSIDNSGNVQFRDGTATLTNLLQLIAGSGITLGATGRDTTVAGALNVAGASSLDGGAITTGGGAITMSGGLLNNGRFGVSSLGDVLDASGFDTFLSTRGSSNLLHFRIGTTDYATVGTGGFNALNGVNFNIGRIKDINVISGSGSGTFNHGLSGTPNAVIICSAVVSGSSTVSAYSYTATQFSVTTGVAGAAWKAIAYR